MTRDSAKRKRAWLMAHRPYCHWCGAKLVWFKPRPHQRLPENFATLDHLNSRNCYPDGRPLQGQLVLSCRTCNEARGAAEVKVMPAEELWQRSGRAPVGAAAPAPPSPGPAVKESGK